MNLNDIKTLRDLFNVGLSRPRAGHIHWRDASGAWQQLSTDEYRQLVGDLGGATDGPGKLCRTLRIDRSLLGTDMADDGVLFVTNQGAISGFQIAAGPRIGIDYARQWALKPWRMWVEGNPHVSRPNRRSPAMPSADG